MVQFSLFLYFESLWEPTSEFGGKGIFIRTKFANREKSEIDVRNREGYTEFRDFQEKKNSLQSTIKSIIQTVTRS